MENTCSSYLDAPVTSVPPHDETILPQGIRAELVVILAGMLLHRCQEASSWGKEAHQKVKADHLKRNAYLYIRQSTLRQVLDNSESTKRQYALRQRAVALGWPEDRIIVIDSDLGQSGASAADREGFQRLVTEVSIGRAGIVLGLEVSRLARNSTDWHRLLVVMREAHSDGWTW
jgi:hypothetical protein